MLDQSQVEEWSRITTEPEPRRRLKGFWAGFITAALFGLVMAAGIAFGQYEPLTWESIALSTSGYSDPGKFQPGLTVQDNNFQDTVYKLDYRDRQSVKLVFQLGNEGRVPVTITRLGLPGLDESDPAGYRGLIRVVRVLLSRERSVNQPESVSFPVRLAHSDAVLVKMDAEIANCESFEATQVLSDVHVRFRALGIPKAMFVPLGGVVSVKSPPGRECPYRAFYRGLNKARDFPLRTETPECSRQEKVVQIAGEAPKPNDARSPEVALAEFLSSRYPHLANKPDCSATAPPLKGKAPSRS